MNVLSLFDGMSCGQLALKKANINYDQYFASEINKSTIDVTKHNFPNTCHIGSVVDVSAKSLPKIDLLVGGSPCQGFSFAGNQLNFDDERSKLFFEFVRLKNELKPTYFLLENVNMKEEFKVVISKALKCSPIQINSNLFSAQNRNRLYWTNIPYSFRDTYVNNYSLVDILEQNVDIKYVNSYELSKKIMDYQVKHKLISKCTDGISYNVYGTKDTLQKNIHKADTKHYAFSCMVPHRFKMRSEKSRQFKAQYTKHCCLMSSEISGVLTNGFIRKLTPLEYERLQTVPDHYTNVVSDNHRYQMLGNGWTVDVIAVILKNIA